MTAGPPGRPSLRIPLAVAAAAAAVYLAAASSRDFWAPDEPDFAQAVREMLERGSLLLPYQNGVPYSEKPALFYWAMAATTPFTGFDVHPAALRLPSVLACAALVFGAAWLAGRRGGPREALVAGAATATAPLVFWQGQFVQIDAFFTALLFWAFVSQLMVEEDPGRASRWVWAFHLLLPLAVLTKGPLAVVLTGLVALVRAALLRSWKPVTGLAPLRGAAVFVLLVVPWYVAAARAGGPEYAYDLVVNQNWNRFFHAFDHIQPWWFYLEKVWGDFSPWMLPALAAPFTLAQAGRLRERGELRFALTVALVVFLFLSASESKQGKYLLVAYPFAAVLLSAGVTEWERRAGRGLALLRGYVAFLAVVLVAGAVALFPVAGRRFPGFAHLVPFVAAPLALGAAGTLLVLFRRRREAAPALLALAATLGASEAAAARAVFPAVDVLKTGRPFYERIRPLVGGSQPLAYFGGTYRSYAILVLRRRTAWCRTEEELAAWLEKNPSGHVLADRSETERWTHPALAGLRVVDRQPVGGDVARLLAR